MTPHRINPSSLPPIGILAGWGRYPEIVAEQLRLVGRPFVVVGIRDHASEYLRSISDVFEWFGIAKMGAQQRFLRQHGVEEILLAGKLFKNRILYDRFGWIRHLPDWECIRTFFPHFVTRVRSSRDDSLLHTIVGSFENRGMTVIPGTQVVPSLLIQRGVQTKTRPSPKMLQDLRYGWRIAKQSGLLDIGQSVTIRDETVLAIEAIEGTDACIERSGQVCPRGGFSLVKVAKPNQDQRFDLPTIGLQTLEKLNAAGGKAIAVEANQTIFVDQEQVIAYANKHRIAIVAWTEEDLL